MRAKRGYYRDKQAGVRVHLTSLGGGLVEAVVARTGLEYSDVVERVLRNCGPQLLAAATSAERLDLDA
jgi:hypothetical protein